MPSLTQSIKTSVMNGVDLFADEFAKKRRKTQNMVIWVINIANVIVISYILILIGMVVVLDAKGHLELAKAVPSMIGYSLVVVIGSITNFAVLHTHKTSASHTPFFICMMVNLCYIVAYALFLESETLFFLFLFTTIPVSYTSLVKESHIRIALRVAVTGTIIAILYQAVQGPLLPLRTAFNGDAMPALYLSLIYITKSFVIITNIAFLVAILAYSHNYTLQTETELLGEKKKSESLLRNILPVHVISELKEKGANTPVRFEKASVIFTDFVGFTRIAEQMPAEEVVDELDKCFTYFDELTDRYNLEKLKTIGDAFMCAGGLPVANKTHAIDCCLAALEIQAFMSQMKEIKESQGVPYWTLRLGINTGPLIAGVVGTRKFAYDVWGDTVNTAARLESSGVPGRINISASTYAEVSDLFQCEHRGKVEAKNKGQIDMFFLTGIKQQFSVGGEGRVPNKAFHDYYRSLS